MKFKGQYTIEVLRKGKSILKETRPNSVVTEGLNKILDVMFHGTTPITTWYIGLLSATHTLSASDTMGSHGGWTEVTAYDEAARQAFVEAAASGGVIAASAAATFTINGSVTVGGIFVTSDSTLSGTSGTLWATALLSADQPLIDDDIVNITYSVTATP